MKVMPTDFCRGFEQGLPSEKGHRKFTNTVLDRGAHGLHADFARHNNPPKLGLVTIAAPQITVFRQDEREVHIRRTPI